MSERVFLTPEQAIELLIDGDMIHTYVNPAENLLMGANKSRKSTIELFEEHPDKIELTGKMARGMKHGIVVGAKIYIETNMTILDEKYPAVED